MTNENTNETIENKRKRLTFRSWHRGTREMDLIMGRFADAHVADFNDDELAVYETILNISDPELYAWICKRTTPPANLMSPILQNILEFNYHTAGESE